MIRQNNGKSAEFSTNDPIDFLHQLTDEQKWGEEQLPLDPENYKVTGIDHENQTYTFLSKSPLDARTLGQHIGVGTLYGDLRVFSSEVFLSTEFPIEDYRLDGDPLSYHETPLDDGGVEVRVSRRYVSDPLTEIENNTINTISNIVARIQQE